MTIGLGWTPSCAGARTDRAERAARQPPSQLGQSELPHMTGSTLARWSCHEVGPGQVRSITAVPVSDLLHRSSADWERATARHPFLVAVRDGTLPGAAFD